MRLEVGTGRQTACPDQGGGTPVAHLSTMCLSAVCICLPVFLSVCVCLSLNLSVSFCISLSPIPSRRISLPIQLGGGCGGIQARAPKAQMPLAATP